MKKLITITTFICATLATKSQIILNKYIGDIPQQQWGVGAGLGILDTSGLAVQFKLQYETNLFGVTGGFISSLPNKGACNFNLELFIPIYFNAYERLAPHAGYVYRMVSADNKHLNGNEWIAGLTYEWGIFDGGVLYIDASLKNKKSFIFLLGMRGLFGKGRACQ